MRSRHIQRPLNCRAHTVGPLTRTRQNKWSQQRWWRPMVGPCKFSEGSLSDRQILATKSTESITLLPLRRQTAMPSLSLPLWQQAGHRLITYPGLLTGTVCHLRCWHRWPINLMSCCGRNVLLSRTAARELALPQTRLLIFHLLAAVQYGTALYRIDM